ncbi:MAG TPA: hypothetical protein VNZ45_14475 [Bacteroidia bacterium]|jgi:hypothetical protein|nr:hypothetical protein [Bacteroidia bacterium]
MKTILKVTACLVFISLVNLSFAQQAATSTSKSSKKNSSKKTKAIDNKIAVSDQAQPTEKGSKKTSKTSGISNK